MRLCSSEGASTGRTRRLLISSFLAHRDPINSLNRLQQPRGGVCSVCQYDYICSRNSAPVVPPGWVGFFHALTDQAKSTTFSSVAPTCSKGRDWEGLEH